MNPVGEVERAVLSGIFVSRVSLAKLSAEEAVEQAKRLAKMPDNTARSTSPTGFMPSSPFL